MGGASKFALVGLALGVLPGGLAVSTRGAASPAKVLGPISAKTSAEGDQDKDAFDKVACWCKTNLAEQERVVSDMGQDIEMLGHDLAAQSAGDMVLDSQLKSHEEELANSLNSLDTVKAIRDKDHQKFQETEQSQTQSLKSLDGALEALTNGRSPDLSLAQLRSLARKQPKGCRATSLLQQLGGQKAGQSPDMVYGVVKQMKATFSEDLEDMRTQEATASERHEGLVDAKSQEIAALKKQLMDKKSRLAKSKVQGANRAQQKERSEKLLDAQSEVLSSMRELCQRNEESFEARQEARQGELVALSSAQAELAGAQLLSVGARGMGGGVDALCSAALEITDKAWRARAKEACEKGRAGAAQDAADATESLTSDLRAAAKEAAKEKEECSQSIQDAKNEFADASQRQEAEAGEISSDKSTAESQIEAINQQASRAEKAKADLAEGRGAQHEVLQSIRMSSVHAVELLKRAAGASGGAAAGKINEAIALNEKLSEAANVYDQQAAADVEQVDGLLDKMRLAAGKALIPLKLLKADSEEDAVKLHEENKELAHAAAPQCDVSALAAKTQTINGYIAKLGDAAESLAYDALR